MHTTIAILGGDQRQIVAKEHLETLGLRVRCWGLGGADTHADWREAVEGAHCILLPLPASEDGVRIRCPLHTGNGIRFSALMEALPAEALLFGGKIPPRWMESGEASGISMWDYNVSEVFQLRNAGPTAEGAILLAVQETGETVNGMETAVLGYGRIASLLAEKLILLGAHVTVYARRDRDLAHAALRGLHTVRLNEADGYASLLDLRARMVFNTVPQQIVTEEHLLRWSRSCVLMELASAPGGFDSLAAERLGFKRIHASALPGRLFPSTAGKLLAQTVYERLTEQ